MDINTTAVLAGRIRHVVSETEITEIALSEVTGIPRTTLRRKLAGHGDLTIPELQALSEALNVPLEEWLHGLAA